MSTTETSVFLQNWDELQEPARPGPFPAAYLLLLAAIDTGWKIEGPVKLAPRQGSSGPLVYHFKLLLLHRLRTHILTVPQGNEVEAFIRDEGLTVVRTPGLTP